MKKYYFASHIQQNQQMPSEKAAIQSWIAVFVFTFYRMQESAVSLLVLLLDIRIFFQYFFPSFIQKNYRKSYDYFLIESIFVYNCQNIPFKMWGPNDHLATLFIDFYYVVIKRCECISSSTSKRIQPESKFFYFTNIASPKLKKRYLSSIAWW